LLLVIGTLSGCLLRAQDHPQAFPSGQSTIDADSSPGTGATGQPEITVFLVRNDRLSAVHRQRGLASDRLTTSLQALVRPLGDSERTAGLRSALPAGTAEPGWSSDGSGVVIGLPAGFEQLATREQVIAIGQLVYTVTENSGAEQVSFTRAGEPIDVPDGAGRLLSRPVTRQDYQQIAPR
jgi:spore germination protein GerM